MEFRSRIFFQYVAVLFVLWMIPSGNMGSFGNEEIYEKSDAR